MGIDKKEKGKRKAPLGKKKMKEGGRWQNGGFKASQVHWRIEVSGRERSKNILIFHLWSYASIE